jgi:pimeloyl-ACP methyl ester carboxylesterase
VRELAVALAERGNRVLIWDRPNCGASDVRFTGPFVGWPKLAPVLQDWADDVLEQP